MTTTSSKDLRLTGIIEEIYSGDYQLPEFQRDYVWKDSNVKSLFESVLLGHPIGSLLILELNKEDPIFAWTNFNGIYPEDNRKLEYEGENKLPPSFLVLDGQQRLTSLSKLTDTNSEKIWFLDLIKLKDSWINFGSPTEDENIKKWIETDVDIVSALSRKKKTDDPEKELRGKKKLMPLKILKNKTLFSNSINEIRDSITEKNAEIKYEIKNYKSLGIKASKDELEKLIDENEIWLKFFQHH